MEIYDDNVNVKRKVHAVENVKVIPWPGKLKIQTTGPGAETLFEDGPTEGHKWNIVLVLDARESDV